MNIEYKIDNGFKVDVIADSSDDIMSTLAPSPKSIIIIDLIIKYERAYLTELTN